MENWIRLFTGTVRVYISLFELQSGLQSVSGVLQKCPETYHENTCQSNCLSKIVM